MLYIPTNIALEYFHAKYGRFWMENKKDIRLLKLSKKFKMADIFTVSIATD